MFGVLGVALALYTLYAAVSGEVFAKAGAGGRLVSRTASPEYFWMTIAVYAGLSAALLFWF